MRNRTAHPSDQRTLIRDLVVEIEALRVSRRLKWRDRQHPENKTWSQEELRDLAYPSYNHLLRGSTQRLPSRAYVLRIADYLECNNHETNDLLLAAQYMPQVVELRADEEWRLIQRATMLAMSLPLPAIVITRGFGLAAINNFFLQLNQTLTFDAIPRERRNVVHWFFDPSLPSYRIHASNTQIWERNTRNMLTLLAKTNRAFQREPWHQVQLQQWHALPRFTELWDDAVSNLGDHQVQHETLATSTSVPTLIREDNVILPMHPSGQVGIGIAIPLCDGARYTYQQAGCSIGEGGWKLAIKDLAGDSG